MTPTQPSTDNRADRRIANEFLNIFIGAATVSLMFVVTDVNPLAVAIATAVGGFVMSSYLRITRPAQVVEEPVTVDDTSQADR